MRPHLAVGAALEVLPAGWGTATFKAALIRREERNVGCEHNMLSLKSDGAVVLRGDNQAPAEASIPRYLVAHPGDLIVNPMWLTGGAIGISASTGAVSPDYRVFRSRGAHEPRYLHHLLRSTPYFDQYRLYARADTTFDRRVQQPDLDEMPLAVPPLDEQRRIADFLDDQVDRIDATIRLRDQQVKAVKERLDAGWADSARALMSESSVVPLRRVLSSIVDGPFGSSLTSAHYSDAGTRVIRLGNLGKAAYRYGDEAFVPEAYGRQLSGHAVVPGDLLIAGLGDDTWPLGRATVAPEGLGPAIVKADCYRARLREGQNVGFFAWFLSSPVAAAEFRLMSRGSTRARLNTGVVRDVHVPLVAPHRQSSVLTDFESERSAAELVMREMSSQIASLRERQRSLVTAAVTGQFDVATVSGREGVAW